MLISSTTKMCSGKFVNRLANVYFSEMTNITRFHGKMSNSLKVAVMSQPHSPRQLKLKSRIIRKPKYWSCTMSQKRNYYSPLMVQRNKMKDEVASRENMTEPLCYFAIILLFVTSVFVNFTKTKK